jgi:hypothetical protein
MFLLRPARFAWCALFVFAVLASTGAQKTVGREDATSEPSLVHEDFDVVIAGGSTAAFAAALSAAESGAKTALIEPTDWVGGQLTSSGVPAIDEAWHNVQQPDGQPPYAVSKVARLPANMTPRFLALLQGIEQRGDCWVSRFCFCPDAFVVNQLDPLERAVAGRLTVFRETVVKRVTLNADGTRIESFDCIGRRPRGGLQAGGYDRLPSQDLEDWYQPTDSDRFTKQSIRFVSRLDRPTVFVDATEWGEVLALSGKDYLQGIEDSDGSLHNLPGGDTCGQAIVYCFAQELHDAPASEPDRPVRAVDIGYGDYHDKPDPWTKIWTYRRLRGKGPLASGDICLQNWGYSAKRGDGGNDYPHAYLFLSKRETEVQRDDWRGGVDLAALAGAEDRAYAWHQWFRRQAPQGIEPNRITLAGAVLGTGHGLAKLPYIRDTRRSIGLDGFVLRFADLNGPPGSRTGTRFSDRVALGAYPADIHPVATCKMPSYATEAHDSLPFYIPFRALTHRDMSNLLVAGKTMAQSFLANSSTRLHPIEWSSGTACGIAAADMARTGRSSAALLADIERLQEQVVKATPIDWTIPK